MGQPWQRLCSDYKKKQAGCSGSLCFLGWVGTYGRESGGREVSLLTVVVTRVYLPPLAPGDLSFLKGAHKAPPPLLVTLRCGLPSSLD